MSGNPNPAYIETGGANTKHRHNCSIGNIDNRAVKMRHASTSPRPPQRPKDAYMSYRQASPTPRRDSPIPFSAHRSGGNYKVSPRDDEEFIPVQPSVYTGPENVGSSRNASSEMYLTCRDCVFFWGLQCLIISMVVAICYLAIHLYQV